MEISDDGFSRTKKEEMLKKETFTSEEWNFTDIWDIDEDNSYPYFQWQDENIPYPPDN
ncbi:MAG: hypothetical protein ACOCRX_10260 [Candidatus Woesearchaeota archaeon]